MAREALHHLPPKGVIINTSSAAACRGCAYLVDDSSTKLAIIGFTRSLAMALADRGIRVNGVAPEPISTPLVPVSFDADKSATYGMDLPMFRVAQPDEVALSYVFLASSDSSYMTGQVLHPNSGEVVSA